MVVKYLTNINDLARLPKEIVRLHPRGYSGSVVEGPKGKGKTTFCMHTGRQVFQYVEGITRDDAWQRVLDNMVFSLEEVDDIFSIIDGVDFDDMDMKWWWDNQVQLFKCWDDAGMHGGKYKYLIAAKLCDNLQGNLDIMRFVLTGFCINSPELDNLLKFIRNYHDHYVILIKGRRVGGADWERQAFFQRWQKDKRNVWKLRASPPHTPYSCFIGDNRRLGVMEQWVMDEYEKLKGKAIQRNRANFKKMKNMVKKIHPDRNPYDMMGVPSEYVETI